MAPRSMTLDVLVRLKDSLSSPLRGLMNSLQGVANMARKIGVVGTAVAAISFMAPIQQAAAFQQKLVDIAGTANLSGAAAYAYVDQIKGKYEDLALKIGQSSDTIASGAGQMIAAGVDPKLIDQSIGGIGRAATAAHAEFNDMAGVATSLMQTLKLPADQLDGALAGLIVSGKEGAFEMKDMAKYLPTLTGQMAKFGVTGREAINFLGSALQIAKKGTSDPAEAANNLKNFLSKILAPATIKNFKDVGVDINAVMQNAATQGINPIEAVVQKISKLTGVSGNEIAGLMKKAKANGLEGAEALDNVREQLVKIHGASKLGGLFSDMQVMDFLIPMLGNIDEYKRIKDEVAKATGAVTDRDFDTQMQALNQQLTIFGEIGTQATREVGLAFGTWLPMINTNLEAGLKWLRDFDQQTGGMVRQALMLAGAGALVAAALGTLGVVLPIVAAGFVALVSLISPVGVALALIAYGATQIYKNWATFGPRVMQTWQTVKRGFFDLADGLWERGQRIVDYGRDLVDRYGPVLRQGFARAWSAVVAGAPAVLERIRSIGSEIIAAGRALAERFGPILSEGFARAWSAVVAGAPAVLDSIRSVGSEIIAAGGELADRFGPRIRDGLASAWTDIKGGLANIRALFDGFMAGLDLHIDLSGLTIDQAKVGAFEALDKAIKGIASGWEGLKGFGDGFAPFLAGIGKDLGSTANDLIKIGGAVSAMASGFGKLQDMDSNKIGTLLGNLTGGSIGLAIKLIGDLADVVVRAGSAIQGLLDKMSVQINWTNIIPGANILGACAGRSSPIRQR